MFFLREELPLETTVVAVLYQKFRSQHLDRSESILVVVSRTDEAAQFVATLSFFHLSIKHQIFMLLCDVFAVCCRPMCECALQNGEKKRVVCSLFCHISLSVRVCEGRRFMV